MVPLIHNKDEVVVAPVEADRVEVGDIVLTKVSGSFYIHLVKAIDTAKRRVLICDNRGERMDGPASTASTASRCRW